MTKMTASDYMVWLSSRYSVFCEFSPTDDAKVSVYNINKYGGTEEGTCRIFIGQSIETALKKAYDYESKELVKQ